MQFEINHKVGTDYLTVTFLTSQSFDFWASFANSLKVIGGEPQTTLRTWKFPSFITSQVITEIIHNTCFVCGGLMKDEEITVKVPNTFRGNLTKTRKCTVCGHSHT